MCFVPQINSSESWLTACSLYLLHQELTSDFIGTKVDEFFSLANTNKEFLTKIGVWAFAGLYCLFLSLLCLFMSSHIESCVGSCVCCVCVMLPAFVCSVHYQNIDIFLTEFTEAVALFPEFVQFFLPRARKLNTSRYFKFPVLWV